MVFCGKRVKNEQRCLTQFRRDKWSWLDQSPILFSGTVWRNVEFGLKVRKVPRAERSTKILSALERVGMVDFAMMDIHGLSGGEVKRVALARALVVDPDVLLCDEPTANVDQKHQEIILEILRHANSVRNTSVIFSTHYLSQSRRLADQTILLQNGSLSDEIGENSFEAKILGTSGEKHLLKVSDNCHLTLPEKKLTTKHTEKVTIHLIPEKIRLCPISGDDRQGCTGKVRTISVEGANVRITVDMGIIIAVSMTLEDYRTNPPQAGQTVRVELPEEAVVIS